MSIVGYNDLITFKVRRKDLHSVLDTLTNYYTFSSMLEFLDLNPHLREEVKKYD